MKFSKKLLICLIALIISSTCAYGYVPRAKKALQQQPIIKNDHLIEAYNAPADLIVEDAWELFSSASFIYWQPKEDGLELGRFEPSNLNDDGPVINLSTGLRSGFKVSLGSHFYHDNWSITFKYLRFHTKEDAQEELPIGMARIRTSWWQSFNNCSNISVDWRLLLDILDFELSRPYYNGTHLTITPFFGARGGWIKQKYEAKSTTSAVIRSYNSSKSHLIGPRCGINTNWQFGSGVRFFADFSANLFYQRFSAKENIYNPNSPDTYELRFKDKIGLLTPNIASFLGLGWGTYSVYHNWHFDILAGYEIEYFWQQNVMQNIQGSSNQADPAAGDLMLNGLTLSIRLDF